ncbi:MlaA family lipoprotein [Desulfobacter curvatus]|uniref:MlaA family lipoprotein n=1 Tax=Desulfobacter curvatus TaxID=2290 RepID=UPI00036D0059|nr:VacJ family lipoprotein [Desulfobacter curvatus]
MKFYIILIVMILTLITGPAVAGNLTDQTGQAASSPGSDISPDPSVSDVDQADKVEDDEFQADIFQEDQADQSTHAMVADPLEGFNRAVFVFNDKLYMYGLRPVSKGYARVVPTFARKSIKNFFNNLFFPIRFINDLLQGKGEAAGMEFSAFFINTTLGFGGLNNFAQKYVGIRLQDEDFGQTLGSYGIGNGFYLVLPILGPSSLRDAVGRAGDWFVNPINYAQPWELSWGAWGFEKVSWTSFHVGEYEAFKEASIDPYTAMRNAYIQNRNALVKDVAGAQKLKNSKD